MLPWEPALSVVRPEDEPVAERHAFTAPAAVCPRSTRPAEPVRPMVRPQTRFPYPHRRFQSGDAAEISVLARKIYGHSYIDPDIYDPENLILLNRKGQLFSAVALNEQGEVIAHAALKAQAFSPTVIELGMAFVDPQYRNRDCLKHLTVYLADLAASKNVSNVFVQSVTLHAVSQKVANDLGFRDTALRLDFMAKLEIRDASSAPGTRLSLVMAALPLRPLLPEPLYVPRTHRLICARIYAQWGARPVFAAGIQRISDLASGPGQFEVFMEKHNASADILVSAIARNTGREIMRLMEGPLLKSCEAVCLHLPLRNPASPLLARLAEQAGFFFSGIFLDPGRGDRLLLQHLKWRRISYENLQVHSELAGSLTAYILRRDPAQTVAPLSAPFPVSLKSHARRFFHDFISLN